MQSNLVEKLLDLREKQSASFRRIDCLKKEHEDWQKSFDELLFSIQSSEGSEGSKGVSQPTSPTCAPPAEPDAPRDAPRLLPAPIALPPGDTELVSEKSTERSGSREGELDKTPSAASFQAPVLTKRDQSGPLHKLVRQELAKVDLTLSEEQHNKQKRIHKLQQFVQRIVKNDRFEYVTGFVIALNLVLIGIEADASYAQQKDHLPWAYVTERLFFFIYCFEALLRFIAGSNIFKDIWFFTDMMLITIAFVALWILPLTVGNSADGVEKLLLVRGVRLLRLVRALRMFKHFKVMWRLVHGLISAGQTIISTTVLILVSLFVFSCMAVELIAKDDKLNEITETKKIIDEHFSGIGPSMVTLMQFVTVDSVAAIYFPIIINQPYLCLFFLLIIVVISIGLMNLVTAVVLENAMESAVQEAEEERSSLKCKVKEAIPELLKIFVKIDKDESGIISRDEMASVHENVLPRRLMDSACVGSILDFFDFLDVDEKGELTQEEFVEGLLNLCLLEMPIHAIQTLKLLHLTVNICRKIDQNLEVLRARTLGSIPDKGTNGDVCSPGLLWPQES